MAVGISILIPESKPTLSPGTSNFFKNFLRIFLSIPYEFSNGDSFKGKCVNGIPHGNGIYCFANGDKLEGSFVNGIVQASIVYYFANGAKYTGETTSRMLKGKGTYTFKNQMSIVADFVNGLPYGKVKITQSYERKGYYVCDFDKDGNFEGVFVSKSGQLLDKNKFTGFFDNGTLTLKGNLKKGW